MSVRDAFRSPSGARRMEIDLDRVRESCANGHFDRFKWIRGYLFSKPRVRFRQTGDFLDINDVVGFSCNLAKLGDERPKRRRRGQQTMRRNILEEMQDGCCRQTGRYRKCL
jgi:hypothetical protein